MIPSGRLQQIMATKDHEDVGNWSEGWAIIDGAIVIYDLDEPPPWLAPVLVVRDDDGNTEIDGVTLMRVPRPGEYVDPQPDLVEMTTSG